MSRSGNPHEVERVGVLGRGAVELDEHFWCPDLSAPYCGRVGVAAAGVGDILRCQLRCVDTQVVAPMVVHGLQQRGVQVHRALLSISAAGLALLRHGPRALQAPTNNTRRSRKPSEQSPSVSGVIIDSVITSCPARASVAKFCRIARASGETTHVVCQPTSPTWPTTSGRSEPPHSAPHSAAGDPNSRLLDTAPTQSVADRSVHDPNIVLASCVRTSRIVMMTRAASARRAH